MTTGLSWEQIVQTNRDMARFMGLNSRTVTYPNRITHYEVDVDFGVCSKWIDMEYHTSYDWLMEVWIKFANLRLTTPSHRRKHMALKMHIKDVLGYPVGDHPILNLYIALRAGLTVINEFN